MECHGCAPEKDQQETLRRTAEHLSRLEVRLDLGLNSLSLLMEECLTGIHGLQSQRLSSRPPRVSVRTEGSSSRPPRVSVSTEGPSSGQALQTTMSATPSDMCHVVSAGLPAVNMPSIQSIPSISRRPPDARASLASIHVNDWVGLYPLQAIQPRQRKLRSWELKLWKFMSNPESSLAAACCNRLKVAFFLLTVFYSVIQGTTLSILNPKTSLGVEAFIEVLFLLEVVTLSVVCPYRKHFLLRACTIIDALSVVPLALRVYVLATGGAPEKFTIIFGGFVPVVRLLKTIRHFQTSHLLANAFILAKEAIPVLLFYYAVVWLLFTAIIYALEDRSSIQTLGDAMWLTLVTMTTVGYGDVTPKTGAGRMAMGTLVLISTLYMAIPLGIIGHCFSTVWNDRDKILLFERLRASFMDVGCVEDVPRLFSHFDRNAKGSLDAQEFLDMCSSLQLGLSEGRLLRLFHFWANPEHGCIEATTFQKILFPAACLKELERQAYEEADIMGRLASGAAFSANGSARPSEGVGGASSGGLRTSY